MLRCGLFLSSIMFALSGGLTACSTVTDNIPTVKIERKKAKRVQTVETKYNVQQALYTAPKVQKAEAAMVCENDNMRSRAADRNMKNDMARVLILEEGGRSSNIIADVEVNCRDYFAAKHLNGYTPVQAVATPIYVPQASRPIIADPAPVVARYSNPKTVKSSHQVQAADGYFYSIKEGDTLYRIARENCSSVRDISQLNGISDPTRIEVHQIIRLPAKKCNSLK